MGCSWLVHVSSARARVPWLFVMPCAYAIVAFVPRLRTVQTGRHFTIVDALLVARFAAEPLFGGSRWRGLDLVRLPVCTRSRRHLRYEHHRDQSNWGPHHHRRQHRRLCPAAVWSLLQILIRSNSKGQCEQPLGQRSTRRTAPCGSGGSGALIPHPDGQRSRSRIRWRCFSKARRLPSSAWSIDSASSEDWPVSSACLSITRWRRIWLFNSAMCR